MGTNSVAAANDTVRPFFWWQSQRFFKITKFTMIIFNLVVFLVIFYFTSHLLQQTAPYIQSSLRIISLALLFVTNRDIPRYMPQNVLFRFEILQVLSLAGAAWVAVETFYFLNSFPKTATSDFIVSFLFPWLFLYPSLKQIQLPFIKGSPWWSGLNIGSVACVPSNAPFLTQAHTFVLLTLLQKFLPWKGPPWVCTVQMNPTCFQVWHLGPGHYILCGFPRDFHEGRPWAGFLRDLPFLLPHLVTTIFSLDQINGVWRNHLVSGYSCFSLESLQYCNHLVQF